MRSTRTLLVLTFLAAACRTGPQQAPVEPDAPPAPPLSVRAVTTEADSLRETTLRLEGLFGPQLAHARALQWRARWQDRTLGEGHARLQPDVGGRFVTALPLKFGATSEELGAYQQEDVLEVLVELTAGEGTDRIEHSRAVRVRSPRLPQVKMLTVQASRRAEGLSLVYIVSVRNPNPFEVRLGTMNYAARLGDRMLITEHVPLAMKIPASGENSFEIPVSATFGNLGRDLHGMLRQPELPWGFSGEVTVSGLRIPFELDGSIRLSSG